jgi:Zn-dependent protease
MSWSVPLGRVYGISLRMHATFLLLLGWTAWMAGQVGGYRASLWALALVLCLFACVLLHELGHCLVAMRWCGVKVNGITLLPIGGVASLQAIPERPIQELAIAVAGPLVNVVIALALLAARGGLPALPELGVPESAGELCDMLIISNGVLVVFNLIPAFPMDGGRILRSLLAIPLPFETATRAAVAVGQMLALGFVGLAAVVRNPVLALIGVFVFLGAEAEERRVTARHRLARVQVRDLMTTTWSGLHPQDALSACLGRGGHSRRTHFLVLADGVLVGLLPYDAWVAALREGGAERRLAEIMERRFLTTTPETRLADMYPEILTLRQEVFPVMDSGRVAGLLTRESVEDLLAGPDRAADAPGGRGSRFAVDIG